MPELLDPTDRFVLDTCEAPPQEQAGECEWCRLPLAGLARLVEVWEVGYPAEPAAVACSEGCARRLAEEATGHLNRWRRQGLFA